MRDRVEVVDCDSPVKTLLLAESHPPTLEHLTGLLSQAGYTVRPVNDAITALEHFSADNPDIVVLSVDLPRVEGQHVVHLIRSHSQGGRVPIVAIDKGHLGRARGVASVLDLKVNAYIPDPLKPGELVPRLEPLVRAAQAVPLTGILATLSRPAVIAGELRGYPLPAQLHGLYRLRRDGVLVAAHRDLSRRVFFLRGGAVSFDSTSRQDSLPRFLRGRGVLTEAQESRVVEALSSGLRIGAALADAGVEAAGEDLLQLLRDYTREMLGRVLSMREGRYAFYAGDEFASEVATVEAPALAPVLQGGRRMFPLKVMAASLRANLTEYAVRSADFSRDLQAMALDTEDLKIALQINGRIMLRDLLAHGRGELRASYTLLWFLKLTGGVTFSPTPVATGSDALSAAAAPDVIAPRKRKTMPGETAAALREEAVRIITRSYFGCLGLDIAADAEAVERAYHETAMRFHPDTHAEFDLSDLKDLLDSVQEKLSAAYRVLSVEEKRKAYLQYLFSRQDVVGRATTINVDAEIALRRGEASLKKRDFRAAMQAFEEAVAFNPGEPEYYSYLSWATYQGSPGPLVQRARGAQKSLKKALTLDPYLERAQIIAAIIEMDLGDAPLARKKLLKVLELNPYSTLAKAALQKVGK
ncbi:response regulator [Corallococcus sp. M34]|nr:response regulator [Citreicoccus inhibens]